MMLSSCVVYPLVEKPWHGLWFQSVLFLAVVSDLCATGDHDCEQICISTPGSYKCACKEGFTLNNDGKTCSGMQ